MKQSSFSSIDMSKTIGHAADNVLYFLWPILPLHVFTPVEYVKLLSIIVRCVTQVRD